ncbi:receptor-type tyrosine-protein phosphatase R isoform X3 [Equus asinus]|uniref:receptor-type tyrosine-protein phosphatase R isoform X3 n=1 Tax=Equus asinus TaxID=9793 RepID=UPI0038F73D46
MRGAGGAPALCLLLSLHAAGCFSGNNAHFLEIHQKSRKPAFIYHHAQDIEKSLDEAPQKIYKHSYRSSSEAQISKRHQIVNSAYPRPAYDPSLNLLAVAGQDLEVENRPLPAANVIVVTLQMDVNRMNVTLLQIFRQGVAAALGVSPQQVHINRLIEKKNTVELFVSPMNRKAGISDALPSEEVLRSLNINVLHQSLSQFGITEVSPEILYRIKEKCQLSLRQDKEKNQEIHLSPITLQPAQSEAKAVGSMVQHEQPPKVLNVVVDPQGRYAPEIKAATSVCPSPFKMKPIGLQERRGSNVSLTLDMSSLGSVEPFVAVPTPREKVAMEYLQSASRILTRSQLRDIVASSHLLQSEFMEIPMNFVDPKEIDIPRHGTKNRYKTILPNPLSRVCLRPKNVTDSLSTYINANYIRGYRGEEKAFIATQGPMINTVNDFWQMVWQEDSPVIVMITKLKEKNEKCVLYWPEKRGIYGKVEVLVISVNECDNYTVRNLVLKQGSHTQHVKHYWYTSWPDHKTPDSAQPLLQLMLDVEDDRVASAGRGPVVVHCRRSTANVDSYLWPSPQLQPPYLISHQIGFAFKASPVIVLPANHPSSGPRDLSVYFRSSRLIAQTRPTSPRPAPTPLWPALYTSLKPSLITGAPAQSFSVASHCLEEKFLTWGL